MIQLQKMTTSSMDRDFRRINIEQYEEDFYEDEIADNGSRGPDMNQVQSFISAGKPQVAISNENSSLKFF